MQNKKALKVNKTRLAVYITAQLFCVVSLIYFTIACAKGKAEAPQAIMCGICMLFACVPDVLQKLFKLRISTALFIFCIVYAICPMLGNAYGLYYYFPWWDKVLHLTGGVVFALFGAYLPKVFLKKDDCNVLLCALFGVLFSIGIAVAWEFAEYFTDILFGTDMQKDVWMTEMDSYLLGELLGGELGEMFQTGNITTVIDGKYVVEGYIDVGRTDTMLDLLIEIVGALIYAVVYIIDKGKHTSFHYVEKEIEKEE